MKRLICLVAILSFWLGGFADLGLSLSAVALPDAGVQPGIVVSEVGVSSPLGLAQESSSQAETDNQSASKLGEQETDNLSAADSSGEEDDSQPQWWVQKYIKGVLQGICMSIRGTCTADDEKSCPFGPGTFAQANDWINENCLPEL